MSDDENALVRRAAAGDELAFEVLVRRHSEAVWRMAHELLHDRESAEDVVQEAFIKAHRGVAAFRGGSSVRTWLLQIAYRTSLDHLRRRRLPVTPLDDARRARARGMDEATRVTLEQAVATLPESEREAFMLVDALGLTREEAAAVVGVPSSTLKSRLARAHARLIDALGEQGNRPAHERTR